MEFRKLFLPLISVLNVLDQISVVLVEPTHPGNIGAVARALKTMGLTRLVLVNPKKFPHYEASKRAAGAEDILDSVKLVESVEQAVANSTLVLGTSVRDREVTWPTFDPRAAASLVVDHIGNTPNTVAVLFGRESSGLTNAEMDLCDAQIRIPANQEYSSLNLASAAQIIAYELRVVSQKSSQTPDFDQTSATGAERRQQPATKFQREGHLQHLQSTLESLGFIGSKPPTVLMRKLSRLYNKANLTIEEIQILRGILSTVDRSLQNQTSSE